SRESPGRVRPYLGRLRTPGPHSSRPPSILKPPTGTKATSLWKLSALTFFDHLIFVDHKAHEALGQAAGCRPFHLDPINVGAGTKTEDQTRIVRGKIASSSDFEDMAVQVSSLPSHDGPDRIPIAPLAHQMHTDPVIAGGSRVPHQDGCVIVDGDQHIDSAVIVEVPNREPSRRKSLVEDGSCLTADVFEDLGRLVLVIPE